MIIYNSEVDKFIKKQIKKIVIPDSFYYIAGNYSKIKYITDVDITNIIDDYIEPKEIYKHIISLNDPDIFFTYCTTSYNLQQYITFTIENYKVLNYSMKEMYNSLEKIMEKKIITLEQKNKLAELLPTNGNLMSIVKFLSAYFKYDKKKWDIKTLKSNLDNFNYTDKIIIHYCIIYKKLLIPIDLAINFKNKEDRKKTKKDNKLRKLIPYSKNEYFYIVKSIGKIKSNRALVKEFEQKFDYHRTVNMQIFITLRLMEHRPDLKDIISEQVNKIIINAKTLGFENETDLYKISANIQNHMKKEAYKFIIANINNIKQLPFEFKYIQNNFKN